MGAEVLNNTLSVKKDLVVAGKICAPTVSGQLLITADPATAAQLRFEGHSGTEVLFTGASVGNITGQNSLALLAGLDDTDANDTISFGSAGVDSKMTLKNGNLGIGTTGPDVKLHVAGAFAASGPSETYVTFADVDNTPSVATGNLFYSGTATETIDSFDDGAPGQIISIYSQAAITYDYNAGNLKCGTADLVTAAGDVTQWVRFASSWFLLAWHDTNANLADGSAGGF